MIREENWGGVIPFTCEEEACGQKERIEVSVGKRREAKGPDTGKV